MAAHTVAADHRIYAGIDLDGTILVKRRSLNPKLDQDLARKLGHRPFMLFTSQGHDARDDPTLAGFWAGLRGWRLFLALRNAQHFTFTDFEEFLSQLLPAGIRPDEITRKLVTRFTGTIQPRHAVAAERAYIAAFFDLHLRGQHSKLLKGHSPQYPQIEFHGR
jgi:hypothetical protein